VLPNLTQDPGIQFYGGKLFRSIRDFADEKFCNLPAPIPTGREEEEEEEESRSAHCILLVVLLPVSMFRRVLR
jgi:hypothetical protein